MARIGLKSVTAAPGTGDASVLEWAQSVFAHDSAVLVSNHAWGRVYRLNGASGEAYLKILPHRPAAPSAVPVSEALGDLAPALLEHNLELGAFVFAGHGGQDIVSKDDAYRTDILSGLAACQIRASKIESGLPQISPRQEWESFLKLLARPNRPRGNPFGYMREASTRRYERIFRAASPLFEYALEAAEKLPTALEHCDLRRKNAVRLSDGNIRLFDWDDAVAGPLGMSLRAQFGGVYRLYEATHSKPGENPDAQRLNHYLESLGDLAPDQSTNPLWAGAFVGVLHFINGFAPFPDPDESTQKAIRRNVRSYLSDLMDLAHSLALTHPEHAPAFIEALNSSGRRERAKALVQAGAALAALEHRFGDALAMSDQPDVFPTITVTDEDRAIGTLTADRLALATEMFHRHGTLMIDGAFDQDLITRAQRDFAALNEVQMSTIKDGGALKVGNKRYMVSLPFEGAFADPHLFANSFLSKLLRNLLSKSHILGSLTAVASMPGSTDQGLHRDNPALFPDAPEADLPAFSIALIIPLVPLNSETGATRVVKGSHRNTDEDLPHQDPVVPLGACYLMDCRLRHQGLANRSGALRPILSLVYQRPWYRDHVNFDKQSPLIVPKSAFDDLPQNVQPLVSWAVET